MAPAHTEELLKSLDMAGWSGRQKVEWHRKHVGYIASHENSGRERVENTEAALDAAENVSADTYETAQETYQRTASGSDRWEADHTLWHGLADEATLWWEGAQNAVENILHAEDFYSDLPDAEHLASERQAALGIYRALIGQITTKAATRQPHAGLVERNRQVLEVARAFHGMYQEIAEWHREQIANLESSTA